MSLKSVREILSEIGDLNKVTLIDTLMEACQELTATETNRNEWQEATKLANQRADLHARRCELALAILRDDEAGLTQMKLQQIADVLWPQPIDVTQKPTDPSTLVLRDKPHVSSHAFDEPDFYITPTWGEKRGYQLVSRVHSFLIAIDHALPNGFEYGIALATQIEQWKAEAIQFAKKFSND